MNFRCGPDGIIKFFSIQFNSTFRRRNVPCSCYIVPCSCYIVPCFCYVVVVEKVEFILFFQINQGKTAIAARN